MPLTVINDNGYLSIFHYLMFLCMGFVVVIDKSGRLVLSIVLINSSLREILIETFVDN